MSARWEPAGSGPITQLAWAKWIDSPRSIDPYLVWADCTAFLGFGGWDPCDPVHGGYLPLLIELDQPGLPAPGSGHPKVPTVFGTIRISAAYFDKDSATPASENKPKEVITKHITGRVQPQCLEMLLCSKNVERFVLGLPRLPATGQVIPNRGGLVGDLKKRVVLGFIDDGCPFAHPAFAVDPEVPQESRVVAIWDQDPERPPIGKWRETGQFDYGAMLGRKEIADALAAGRQPRALSNAAYVSVDYIPSKPWLGGHAMSRFGGPSAFPGGLPAGTMLEATHGAGVMSLAMGLSKDRKPPLREWPASIDRERDRRIAAADNAIDWRAVFVQLPTAATLDTSGGSLGVHVLDGLHFIIDQAQRIRPDGDNPPTSDDPHPDGVRRYLDHPIVVTISYGAIAGAHDGTSILECAINELVGNGARQRLWVVVAAGNAHGSRTHARQTLRRGGRCALVWEVPPDNPHETYLEVWLPSKDREGNEWPEQEADNFRVRVQPPGRGPLEELRVGEIRLLVDDSAEGPAGVVAGVIIPRCAAQTATRSRLALIAVAPTRAALPTEGPKRALAPHGEWCIEVDWRAHSGEAGIAEEEVEIQAWTERNDLLYGTRRGQQSRVYGEDRYPEASEQTPGAMSRFEGPHKSRERLSNALHPGFSGGSLAGLNEAGEQFWVSGRESTTASRRTGHTVVAGGYRRSDGEMAAYSSGGPGREASLSQISDAVRQETKDDGRMQRPQADAPSDQGSAVRGLQVHGMVPGAGSRLAGTSAAAPTVARFIANALYIKEIKETDPELAKQKVKEFADLAAVSTEELPRAPNVARTSLTPRMDDAFRKGRFRVR